ncbi:MAG: N-acetyltransferase [Betaproteobacteria bacterium]|nr:MAG: N-acetyltransferase [Betaproteobacteria bacterium]
MPRSRSGSASSSASAPDSVAEQLRVAGSLAGVAAADWNALLAQAGGGSGNPFMRHEFLAALLETGCASARTGWRPQFLLLEREGRLAGAMPLYVKAHSWGEYVFDWAWADAYQRHGLAYYPKLLCAVPFTPVAGPRLLAADAGARRSVLAGALEAAREFSSLHVLFPQPQEAGAMRDAGMILRRTVQFHWTNAGYADFEDFLSRLTHRRRKVIRQERRRVREAGIAFRWLRGAEIESADWEFFERCYRRTYAAHRSTPYLNLEFFQRLGTALPQHTLMILAERRTASGATPVAAALNLVADGVLYGRYWGAAEAVPLLHFEACYYQAIEYAITHGLERFEGGAQGEHKMFRGLLPVETLSAHWLAHPGFASAIEQHLARETRGMARYVDELNEHSPFKR